ncbi:hypothetical protein COO60DRAFT_1506378 [Scenedesmus sp. NREL 46B-D3]|nr:hypothetical protein COO60DRAFT_1506378 [Scenedesmus sp. NREL 46B-D3]
MEAAAAAAAAAACAWACRLRWWPGAWAWWLPAAAQMRCCWLQLRHPVLLQSLKQCCRNGQSGSRWQCRSRYSHARKQECRHPASGLAGISTTN